MKRLVVGISGASGAIYGVRFLELLRGVPDVEAHLIISDAGRRTIVEETDYSVEAVEALAPRRYRNRDIGAAVASGSFKTAGMVIVPCSMKTLAGIRTGYADGLIARAADVTLKERRRLVLVPRETPLSEIHLDNMLTLARMGAIVMPPMPAFYNHPASIGDIVDHLVTRILDQFDIDTPDAKRWNGVPPHKAANLKAVNV